MNVLDEDDSKNFYKCDNCDRLFSRKVQYEKHRLQHITPVVDHEFEPLDCKICGKKFKHENSRRIHVQRHKIKPVCNVCGRKFCSRSSLSLHLRVHSMRKRHDCEMCGKYFPSEDDVVKHRLTCNEGKPFSCDLCHERFTWRDQLASHYCVPSHEIKTESDDIQSGSSVVTRSIDVYQVTDDKSISCGICQRHFSQKGHLILHYRRTHNRELLIEKL